jgi:TolB-like protein/DNA-binding winged helix-turn-helix (wHTH) protein
METNWRASLHRFGAFEIDLGTGELRKRGFRVGLQDQPLRVLAALLERPGEVVSREELCRRLWPHGTYVDFEHSLNAAVRRLRLALNDEAAVPRFVETVHRRGYRFLALNGTILPHSGPGDGGVPSRDQVESERPRLAVLPFAPDGAFSDGLTEEIVTQLARLALRHVRVITRTAVARALSADSFPASGSPPRGAAEIGRALGAAYLVEGSVRQEGARLRISAHLIEAAEETHVWASTFDRLLEDELAVQTELGDAIAHAVSDALLSMTREAVGF